MTNTPRHSAHAMEPIAVSPDEAARLCGIGRTTLYAAISSGELKSLKIRSRRLITLEAIHDWLKRHEIEIGE